MNPWPPAASRCPWPESGASDGPEGPDERRKSTRRRPHAPASDHDRRKPVRIPSLTRILSLLALSGACLGHALVGDWTSYTHLEDVRDLQGWKGNMYAATGGGIIRISPNGNQEVYRNTEGLRDVAITALASDPSGDLYATSELGYLYRYRAARNDWEILSTAYRGAGWKMRERALVYRSGYLVLGSEKGLSFFNVAKKVADANVSKMEAVSSPLVNSVLFVEDTLFAGTNRGIFRVTLHLDKLLSDPATNIFNPAIWTKVPGTDGELFFNPEGQGDPAFTADSLMKDSTIHEAHAAARLDAPLLAHGLLYHGAHGIGSEFSGSEIRDRGARVSAYDSVFVEGEAMSIARGMEAIGQVNDIWYTGASYGLYRFYPELKGFGGIIPNRENIPRNLVTAIRANRHGVHAYSAPLVYRLNGKVWDSIPGLEVANNIAEAGNHGQHGFDVRANGEIYVGTWGNGFHAFSGGVQKTFNATNSCFVSAVAGNYSVTWSQAQYKDKGIWFTILSGAKPYHIGYYDFARGSIACFEPRTNDTKPSSVQVVGNSDLVVVTERGVDAFEILDNGVAVTLDPVNRLARLKPSGSADPRGQGRSVRQLLGHHGIVHPVVCPGHRLSDGFGPVLQHLGRVRGHRLQAPGNRSQRPHLGRMQRRRRLRNHPRQGQPVPFLPAIRPQRGADFRSDLRAGRESRERGRVDLHGKGPFPVRKRVAAEQAQSVAGQGIPQSFPAQARKRHLLKSFPGERDPGPDPIRIRGLSPIPESRIGG